MVNIEAIYAQKTLRRYCRRYVTAYFMRTDWAMVRIRELPAYKIIIQIDRKRVAQRLKIAWEYFCASQC
jgi:hypothetical protein